MSNHQDAQTPDLNELLRQAAVKLGAEATAAPLRNADPAPRPQINRNPVTAWWRNVELGKELFRYGVKMTIFTICFGFCAFVSREPSRYGMVAHIFGGLLNPIPLALAVGTLGVVALVRRQFGLMTLAQQLLVAHLIALQIV